MGAEGLIAGPTASEGGYNQGIKIEAKLRCAQNRYLLQGEQALSNRQLKLGQVLGQLQLALRSEGTDLI